MTGWGPRGGGVPAAPAASSSPAAAGAAAPREKDSGRVNEPAALTRLRLGVCLRIILV